MDIRYRGSWERYAHLVFGVDRGAALAYGPVLATTERTQPLFRAVITYALCGEAPLLRELGIDPATIAGNVRVRYEPLPGTAMGDLPRVLETPCP